MERFFRNPQTIRQNRQGPLGAYIDDFAQLLSDQGCYPRMRSTGGRIQPARPANVTISRFLAHYFR